MVSVQSSDDSMIAVASQREELQQQHEEEAQRILKELERAEIKIEEQEYKIEFVKETFSENFSVTVNETFAKTWTFRNAGQKHFVAGALKLGYDSGHDFG